MTQRGQARSRPLCVTHLKDAFDLAARLFRRSSYPVVDPGPVILPNVLHSRDSGAPPDRACLVLVDHRVKGKVGPKEKVAALR